MRRIASINATKTVNFAVGIALLVMLFPHQGKPIEKPAGVRTAIETANKKISLGGSLAGMISF